MIAFDSNILIYVLMDHPDFGKKAEAVFHQIQQEGGSCSVLAITETMYGNIDQLSKIPLLASSQISIIPTSAEIAELAGKLKLCHFVKNIDAIHLASAIIAGANEFVTNDQFLLKQAIPEIKISGL